MTPEVSCDVAGRWLSRAIDEEITPEEERQLESHLDSCSRCRSDRERLFSEVELLESGWGGVSDEIEGILRERMGDDPIAFGEKHAPVVTPDAVRPRSFALLAAAVVLVGLTFLLWVDQSGGDGPIVKVAWGPNGIEHSTGGRFTRFDGEGSMSIRRGSRLELPTKSEAWLTFADGSYSRFGEGSRLRIDALEGEVFLELESGRAAFQVEPREGAPFVVLTSLARIEVVGTRFGVVRESARTIVTVSEGEVLVHRRDNPTAQPFVLRKDAEIVLTPNSSHFTPGAAFLDGEFSDLADPASSDSEESSEGSDRGESDGGTSVPGNTGGGRGAVSNPEEGGVPRPPSEEGPLDMPHGGKTRPPSDEDEEHSGGRSGAGSF